MNPPQFTLKLIVCIHFILTVWGSMGNWLPLTYVYVNLFVLMIGLLGIVLPENADAVLMFLVLHIFSILEDIILLGLYQPRGDARHERDGVPTSERNEYRFALGMCITNLIIKPFTAFLLFRVFKDRGGNYGDLGIPGVENFKGFGGHSGGGGYENIDQPVPPNNVDTMPPQHMPPPQQQHTSEKPPLH